MQLKFQSNRWQVSYNLPKKKSYHKIKKIWKLLILILNYSLQGGNCNLKLCMVSSVNKEQKDKMVTELSIGILKKKRKRNMNIHQDSTASLPNNCVWSGYISVEYSTWPIYYFAWPPPQPQIHAYTKFLKLDPPTFPFL